VAHRAVVERLLRAAAFAKRPEIRVEGSDALYPDLFYPPCDKHEHWAVIIARRDGTAEVGLGFVNDEYRICCVDRTKDRSYGGGLMARMASAEDCVRVIRAFMTEGTEDALAVMNTVGGQGRACLQADTHDPTVSNGSAEDSAARPTQSRLVVSVVLTLGLFAAAGLCLVPGEKLMPIALGVAGIGLLQLIRTVMQWRELRGRDAAASDRGGDDGDAAGPIEPRTPGD
jgi:hypothetical protein